MTAPAPAGMLRRRKPLVATGRYEEKRIQSIPAAARRHGRGAACVERRR